MMLSDRAIRESIWPTNAVAPTVYVPIERDEFGDIAPSQVQPASLDVRLDRDFIRHPSGERVRVRPGATYSMAPGECLLGCLVERLRMTADNLVARIEGKSSLARKFLTVHSAGFIDPGFCGDLTLELKNDGHGRIELVPGMLIAQLSFQFLAAPAMTLYGQRELNSHYQNQRGPTDAAGSIGSPDRPRGLLS
jgi:dCTP deaminase